MIFKFSKQVEFLQVSKTIIFHNTHISNMQFIKNSPPLGSLKETFLEETFDVKVRLQVHLLSGLHRGRMCFCLSSIFKETFLRKLFNDTLLWKLP